jgi:hypothetical protein
MADTGRRARRPVAGVEARVAGVAGNVAARHDHGVGGPGRGRGQAKGQDRRNDEASSGASHGETLRLSKEQGHPAAVRKPAPLP